MLRVRDAIARVAAAPRTTVLITGESGVGKELVARAIHDASTRASRPFTAVNCAALGEALFEAELFGYVPGAFTGASSKGHPGLIAATEGGTLLLDEIGELPLALQAKLLRALQERVYRPVGALADRAFDLRIIASTNRDLSVMVVDGRFREDFFYRLNVMSIQVPPLRERVDDIADIAEHLRRELGHSTERPTLSFEAEALRSLLEYRWPGNVRELSNRIERALLSADGNVIRRDDLGLSASDVLSTMAPFAEMRVAPGNRTLRAIERAWVLHVLELHGGNKSAAARDLGVDRTTLYSKLAADPERASASVRSAAVIS